MHRFGPNLHFSEALALTLKRHALAEFHSQFSLTFIFAVSNVSVEEHMNKSTLWFVTFALLLCVAVPLHAQDGCVNSPENPTAILAVVGSAGAFITAVRARIKARRK
jgi:XrtJ-associated TM-motif-TM protein